jgi:hypothetical protein
LPMAGWAQYQSIGAAMRLRIIESSFVPIPDQRVTASSAREEALVQTALKPVA